jgi:mannose-6-phosphate isomerase-like protein (cupin superfamily)
MEIIRAWEEQGVKIPAPYARTIKVLFAPDRGGVDELTFSFALLDPGGQTDNHTHDRPELIYVVSGRGVAISGGRSYDIQGDIVLWVRAQEEHQIRNTGAETLKLATVFVPAYTAEANYKRCLEAARAITQASNKF